MHARDERANTSIPDRFVWPPGPLPLDADGVSAPSGPARGRSRARAAAIEIERVWLGLDRPPLADRMFDAGWLPDAPDVYCPRCGADAGPFEADFDGCPECRSKRLAWTGAVRLGRYEGLLRESVLEFKHGPWRRLGQDLGKLLGIAVAERMRLMKIDPRLARVVPVPTTHRRRLARGIDHTLVLAREVSRVTGAGLVRAVARRHGPPQTRTPISARRGNVSGVFRVRIPARMLPGLVIVVDDVRTTGATMSGVCRTIREGAKGSAAEGVECWAATLGVAPDARRGDGPRDGRGGGGS